MKMTKSLAKKARYAANFVAAREQIIQGDYLRAFKTVTCVYRDFGCEGPCGSVPPVMNALYALSAWNLQKPRETFAGCAMASGQILGTAIKNSRSFSDSDQTYLLYYLKYLLQFAESDFGYSDDSSLADLRNYRGVKIDLQKIAGLLRRSFPIDQDWLESQWAEV